MNSTTVEALLQNISSDLGKVSARSTLGIIPAVYVPMDIYSQLQAGEGAVSATRYEFMEKSTIRGFPVFPILRPDRVIRADFKPHPDYVIASY